MQLTSGTRARCAAGYLSEVELTRTRKIRGLVQAVTKGNTDAKTIKNHVWSFSVGVTIKWPASGIKVY